MIIKTIIIDDETENIALLEEAVNDIYDVELIATFSRAEEFFKVAKKLKFELCIIDYHLPGMNGYECMKRLSDKKMILTSPLSIPADEAMEIEEVIDVIRITKPLNKERISKAIKKVRDEILGERGFVIVKSYPNNIRQLAIADIVYITPDTDSRFKIIHTKDEKVRTQKYTLEDLLEKLPEHLFCRVNKGAIINIDYFHSYVEADSILLQFQGNTGKPIELTLSDTYYDEFANKLGIDPTS